MTTADADGETPCKFSFSAHHFLRCWYYDNFITKSMNCNI